MRSGDPNYVFARRALVNYAANEIKKNRPRRFKRLKKREILGIFDHLFDIMGNALLTGKEIHLQGFGSFTPLDRCLVDLTGRLFHNCMTGELSEAKKKYMINSTGVFFPSAELRRRVSGEAEIYDRYFNDSSIEW